MTEADVYKALTEIFKNVFDDEAIELRPTTSARDIPDWDSFAHINIIVGAESKFGVKFSTTEVEALKNVGDFVALILRKSKR